MCLAALVVAALTQAEVANPEYEWWASCRPGSFVTSRLVLEGKVQEGLVMKTLKSIDAHELVIEETNGIAALGAGNAGQPRERRIRAKLVGSPGLPEKVNEGNEDIEVGGTKLKCTWIEYKQTLRTSGKVNILRIWLNEDIPGKSVQLRTTAWDGRVGTLVASKWEKK